MVGQYGTPRQRQLASTLERETRQAIDLHDANLLDRKSREMYTVSLEILREQPSFWAGYLSYAQEKRALLRDQAQADQLFQRAYQAQTAGDLIGLRAAVEQLFSLLPVEQQKNYQSFGGSTMR